MSDVKGTEHLVQINDLVKVYGTGFKALDGVSLSVGKGEIVGYLGPNGAGKTTTIKVMTNLLRPTDGQVLIDGLDVNRNPKRALQKVGSLIEVPGLYEYLTPREVMTYLGKVHRMDKGEIDQRITEVLELLKIDEWVDEKLGSFSTGMQRRFGIGAAILHKPELLILDEPVIGLDPKGIRHVRELMKQFREDGMTVFLSSHLLGEVSEICDRVIFLDHGKIIEQGSVSEIMSKAERKMITVMFLSDVTDTDLERIGKLPLVESVERVNGGCRLAYDGTRNARAKILSSLMSSGLGVVSYEPSKVSLEDFYMSIMGEEKGVS